MYRETPATLPAPRQFCAYSCSTGDCGTPSEPRSPLPHPWRACSLKELWRSSRPPLMQSAIRSSRHSRRLSRAARTGLLVLAVVFCALLATASTSRTPRAHRPLPVQQLQTSARSKSHAQTHAKPLAPLHGLPHGKLHSTTHAGPQRRSAHPLTHAHSRSRIAAHAIPPSRRRKHPVPADNPDPPTVERTRAHRSPSHPLSPAEARRATALQLRAARRAY